MSNELKSCSKFLLQQYLFGFHSMNQSTDEALSFSKGIEGKGLVLYEAF